MIDEFVGLLEGVLEDGKGEGKKMFCEKWW